MNEKDNETNDNMKKNTNNDETQSVVYQPPRYCAPIDFGDWHLTVDGKTTLCGDHKVKEHHLSGEHRLFDPHKDCTRCYRVYRTGYVK